MRRRVLCLAVLAALATGAAHAAETGAASRADTPWYSLGDNGTVGLLQMPTARMNAAGTLGITASRVAPYTRLGFMLQPEDWLQVAFRYTAVTGVPYGPTNLSGNQNYKDKSVDAKARLWRESRWWPAVSVGMRDVGGTGLFSGEYVVASKRWYDLDVSLGLGWGYVGARGDLPNPLGWLDNRFKTRPAPVTANNTGQLNTNAYFRGRTALFGGVIWHTPFKPLSVKLEYDGNNYQHEPKNLKLATRSPFNLGLVYRASRALDVSLGYERGNTAMLSLTLHTNLADDRGPPKVLDPEPETEAPGPAKPATRADWAAISQRLRRNAGIDVSSVSRRGDEVIVTGTQRRYFYPPKGVGRAARILDHALTPDTQWFTVRTLDKNMPIVQTSVHRPRFDALLHGDIDDLAMHRSVELDPPIKRQDETTLFRRTPARYHGGFGLGYQQILGGPDAFILYQLDANYDADLRLSRHWWASMHASANLLNNYSGFTYTAPSSLPRVRTYQREYVTTSRVNLTDLQLSGAWRLAPDWYGMVYGGLLESMYGGAGGELLYRPFGSRWALGVDANWVRQRGFAQHFGWRDYHATTGHVTAYVDTGIEHVLAKVSVGRYLAGDWGSTIDLSRVFGNGVRMGGWVTLTNVSRQQFGEGGFDKGIYITIPFDLLLPRSSPDTGRFIWQPLTRDGGAPLHRRYTLYDLTSGRNPRLFYDNFDTLTQ